SISPHDSGVISITQMHAGDAYNVIPETAVLRGTIRAFKPEVMDKIVAGITRVCNGAATMFGAKITPDVRVLCPALVNNADETKFAADIAASIVGEANVDRNGAL